MHNKSKKILSFVLSTSFAVSFVFTNGAFSQAKAADSLNTANTPKTVTAAQIKEALNDAMQNKFSTSDPMNRFYSKYKISKQFDDNQPIADTNPNELVRVIVQMSQKPVVKTSIGELKVTDKANQAKISDAVESVEASQTSVKQQVLSLPEAKIRHTYGYLLNGFSAVVKRSDISKIAAMSGVTSVKEANVYKPDMTSAKGLTQAYDTWKELGYKGEGTVVAIVDTGIDYTHKDMKAPQNASKEKLTETTVKQTIANTVGDGGKFFTDKVPYGYNFADDNQEVTDRTSSMHGMHVSGIVAADGSDDEVKSGKAIQGVAPEAQLLAMKVFSNDPNNQGAYSDDIAAAIDSSVTHGADVINMSLGSTAAFQDSTDPEQVAIKNATDAGVVVVVSAGNSQYSTAPYKIPGVPDTGLVGSPGLAKDALQVASYENSQITCPAFRYTAGSTTGVMPYFTSDVDPTTVFSTDQKLNIVDCGFGSPDDFTGKNLAGKIALIQRGGGLTFVEKKQNAQAAGAAGAIVYNKTGDNSYVSMATDTSITIPAVFVSNTDGVKLKSLIASGVTVNYSGDVKSTDNPNSNDFSDFTSWGPTPNLDFKPEISAPGGNIYSTVNNNKYETMSGTSMASPHTAGSEALIVEAIKAKNLGLTGRDLVDFAKNTAINTAKTEIDSNTNLPYSPRRQGAGLVQIKDAINNNVTVTQNLPGDAGRAVVPLQQIGKSTTFDLTLTNYGSKDATYTLSDLGGALSEQPDFTASMSYDVKIDGASVKFDKSSVTVPAKKTATVKVTIDLPDTFATEQFVEGYVKFNSSDVNTPSLVVPYMGFYGDWSKPQIVDSPIWTPNYYITGSELIGTESSLFSGTSLYELGETGKDANGNAVVDPDKIAISPTGGYESVIPYLGLLRNAKTLKVQVLDASGKVVRQCAYDTNVTKDVLADETSSGARKYSAGWAWDGKVFDAATGSYKYADDGQYTLRVVAAIDYNGAKEQTLDMPVKVDKVAPSVNITSATTTDSTEYTVKWSEKDLGGSGLNGTNIIFVNGERVKPDITKEADGVYSAKLNLTSGANSIIVATGDYADNLGYEQENIEVSNNKQINITFDNLKSGATLDSSDYEVTGTVSKAYGKFTINGVPVTQGSIENGSLDSRTFTADLHLQDGKNKIAVYLEDTKGNKVYDYSIPVYVDTTPPVFNVTSPTISTTSYTVVNEVYNGKINVKGNAYDNGMGYTLTVNGEQLVKSENDTVLGKDGNGKDFDLNVPVSSRLFIIAEDTVGNWSRLVAPLKINAPTITGIEPNKAYKSVTPVIDPTATTVTLDGQPYVAGTVINTDGTHTLVAANATGGKTTVDFKVNTNAVQPKTPTIHASTTDPTNSPVVVSIDGWEDAFKKEYRLVMGEDTTDWKNYTGAFNMTVNGTVYARATDELGTVSDSAYLDISNILTTAPNTPTITEDVTTATYNDVTVAINYPDNSVMNLYSEDGVKWHIYTKALTVKKNETVYAKAIDAAGNESEVATLDITNIDKVAPVAPVISVDTAKPTSKGVTATITYPADSVKNEYSLDGTTFAAYTAPVTVSINGTVYARATDAAGNVSTSSVTVSNIDKTSKPFKLTKKSLDGTGYLKATVNVSKYTEYDAAPVVVFELFKKTAGSTVLTPVSIVTGQKSLTDSEDMTAGFNITDSASNYTVKAFVVDSLTNDASSVGTSLADSIDLGN